MGNYFIKFEDGPDMRRKLLESSKASLHILKQYQELLRVRGEKLSQMESLRHQLREITVLLNRAEELMPILSDREIEELQPKVPKQKFIEVPKAKEKAKQPQKQAKSPKQVPKAPEPRMTELERLEAQLSDIEGKLGNL